MRYHCGGAWGQQENLSAKEVAGIVCSTPGPHHVWAPGMPDWAPAESVPEIAEAIAGLGGTTAPLDEPIAPVAAVAPVAPSPKTPRTTMTEMQRRLGSLAAIVGGFALFLLAVVAFFGKRPAPEPVKPPSVTEVVKEEPKTPAPTPRIDAVSRRPASWLNQPIRDPLRKSGTAQASSELREGGGKLHGARNVTDFRASTAWCEGNGNSGGPGEGQGEWIQLATPCAESAFRELVGLEILAGYTDKPSDWKQNNRPSELQLTLTIDGRVRLRADVFLANRPGYQFLALPYPILCQEGQTARVKLEIGRLYSGSAYSDACVSGLALYERSR